MKYNYDSFDYWQGLIDENKTIRSHMFMDKLPDKKSVYMHSLLFSKKNGLNNNWSYFPNERTIVGYIQYSFLQEVFYKWIYGKERLVIEVPNIPVERIISDAQINKKISKEEATNMRRHVKMIADCWSLPSTKIIKALQNFARDFNKTWYGDHKEFLYIKIFSTAEELGDFVVKSSYMTATEEEFKSRTGVSINDWKEICSKAISSSEDGEKFKNILLKSLTEIT